MKLFKLILFFVLTLLLIRISPVVGQDIPKGLEDKGPLTKKTFIHYRKKANPAKPPSAGGNKLIQCYGFLANAAKWKTTEDYIVNDTNSGNSHNFVLNTVNAGIAEWETYGGGKIFGIGVPDKSAPYNPNTVDGRNVVAFGYYGDPDVIAVTTVWGYFSVPPQTRVLVEWDMLFNTGSFSFGINDNPDIPVMDLQNIATHELGHSAGMDDVYSTSCTLETEYGYSDYGEIIKRDLHNADIAGIKKLYR